MTDLRSLPLPRGGSLLKDEPCTRVTRLPRKDGEAVVRKTYRPRPYRTWQSWMVPSRAEREFRNLVRAREIGVPCVEALSWTETRWLGCAPQCSVETRYVPSSRTVKDLLGDERWRAFSPGERHRVLDAMGRLVRRMHDGGILWAASSPRNLMVVGTPTEGRVLAVDLPNAVLFRGRLTGRSAAGVDLFDLAFSPSRERDFSRAERWRILLAYCDGDRRWGPHLWRRMQRWGRARHRLLRAVHTVPRRYLFPFFVRVLGGGRSRSGRARP